MESKARKRTSFLDFDEPYSKGSKHSSPSRSWEPIQNETAEGAPPRKGTNWGRLCMWVMIGVLLGAAIALAIALPLTLSGGSSETLPPTSLGLGDDKANGDPKACEKLPSSNVFLGLGDDNGYDNSRRARNNTFLNSETVKGLKLKCKFDIAALEGKSFLDGIRIIGPRGI